MSEHNVRTIINKKAPIKNLDWDFNDRSYKEYTKHGLTPPDSIINGQQRKFITQADPKGKYKPIRTVTKIVRCKAPDWEDSHEKSKEYLYWFETWRGKDFQGRTIPPVTDHIEGRYDEIVLEDVINKYGELEGQKMVGKREKYYMPFSKENVDKIIARSENTDKLNINFTFKGPTFRNDRFNYEQFTTYSYERMIEAMSQKGGPEMDDHWNKADVRQREEFRKKNQQIT